MLIPSLARRTTPAAPRPWPAADASTAGRASPVTLVQAEDAPQARVVLRLVPRRPEAQAPADAECRCGYHASSLELIQGLEVAEVQELDETLWPLFIGHARPRPGGKPGLAAGGMVAGAVGGVVGGAMCSA